MLYILLTFVMIILMLFYFKIANYYNIIDKPNERSSHTELTIRGGGVIFLVSALLSLIFELALWMPILGMLIIGVISFIDDRINLSNKVRVFFHLCAVTLLFLSLNVFHLFPGFVCVLLYILVIGIINAYNFMDGINGITGVYTLVVLGGLQYVNYKGHSFIEPNMIWLPILACLVFLFFNFRKRAKCFAGDVGSISIAFWIIYLLFKLIIQTENYLYILFLAVYGVDAVLTIVHRILLKQNIFQAHRLHFYQMLANELKWPHLLVSAIYGLVQVIVVALVILAPANNLIIVAITLLPMVILYVGLKNRLMIVNS